MKLIAKLTAIAALAALTGTAALAGPSFQPTTQNVKPRVLVTPVAAMKCDTMVINGGGRNGMQVVSCKHYASIRPDDCRRACANK